MYYWTCPRCGANLDAGERCDCKERRKAPDMARVKARKPRADPEDARRQ